VTGSRTGVARGSLTAVTGVLGASVFTYLFLSVAGRLLGPTGFAPVSTLWALVFTIGPGLMLPVQQQLGKLLAARRPKQVGGALVGQVALLAAALVAATWTAALLARSWLVDSLLGGQEALFWCFMAAVAAYAVMFLVRGVVTGVGDFGQFAALLVVEAVTRAVIGLGLGLVNGATAADFGVAIALAPLVSAAVVTRMGARTRLERGAAAAWRVVSRSLGWLVAASLLSQLLANIGPLVVELLAPADQAEEAGRFLSALVVTRVALYLFQAGQATLLPNLAAIIASGPPGAMARATRSVVAVMTALTVVSALGAAALGPWAVTLLFGDDFVVTRSTMAMLAAASGLHVLGAAVTSALVAASQERLAALAWASGCATFPLGLLLSEDLFLRVQLGYLVGTATTVSVLLVVLSRLVRGEVTTGSASSAWEGPSTGATSP
jgi:O-antigen/teichoic acid export membrane protein